MSYNFYDAVNLILIQRRHMSHEAEVLLTFATICAVYLGAFFSYGRFIK